MNPNEEKLINSLKYHASDHTPTLTPHPYFKGKFQSSFFYVDGHAELLQTARALIYLSMRVLDPEFGVDDVLEKKRRRLCPTSFDNCQPYHALGRRSTNGSR